LSHKEFRQTAEVLRSRTQKIEGKRRNILNWFDDIIEARPGVEADLEHTSGAIFDKVGVLFKDKNLRRVLPSLRTMIDQLSAWKFGHRVRRPARNERYAKPLIQIQSAPPASPLLARAVNSILADSISDSSGRRQLPH